MLLIIYSQSTLTFLVSENTCTDGSVQENSDSEDESCLEPGNEINVMPTRAVSGKDKEHREEETLSHDQEDTRSQDTLLSKLLSIGLWLCSCSSLNILHTLCTLIG